jgi:hypothetical protein
VIVSRTIAEWRSIAPQSTGKRNVPVLAGASLLAAAWWLSIPPDLELHQLCVLTCTAEAFDRKDSAREALIKHSLSYVDGKQMVRARPEVAIERAARAAFLRGVQQLKLDSEPKTPLKNGYGLGVGWRDLRDD